MSRTNYGPRRVNYVVTCLPRVGAGGGDGGGAVVGIMVESLFMKWKQRLLLLRVQIECFSLRAFYGADLLGCLVSLFGAEMRGKGMQASQRRYIYIYICWGA